MKQQLLENISENNLESYLISQKYKKIFVVTGRHSYKGSGAEKFIENALLNIKYIRFYDFEKNPKYEDVIRGVAQFKKDDFDCVIAIGGGSVIDMAKLINIFSSNAHVDSLSLLKSSSLIKNRGEDFIAIPTTAGTGSEATHFAVIYHNKKKYSVAHKYVLPNIVGLNHNLSVSQSKYLTACTGLDALSQAIESYWSTGSTEESKDYAKKAIKLILNNIEPCVNNPNLDHRKEMLIGSYYAGKAINISKTTAPHAMSYVFTSYFDVPHGHAVFLTLPSVLLYNYNINQNENNDSRGVDYVRKNLEELSRIIGFNSVAKAKEHLINLMKKIGIETNMNKLGIDKKDLKTITSNVNLERLKNNPRILVESQLLHLLSNLF